ncbi:hypothetical protein TWF703_001034 [Orbilia oligospora]|uniref:BZIP domain-containing protein n=2 Tax=Orbilia oligospora TaxID=2813651 RepID=A0A7C8JSN0_ORBOL|nr:hypothetical protein TWF703_001034 [Orbilia oligospora]
MWNENWGNRLANQLRGRENESLGCSVRKAPSFKDSPDFTTAKITSLSELPPPQTVKISPSTDALRYAQAQDPPGWPNSLPQTSPLRQNPNQDLPINFTADFELFGPPDPSPNTINRRTQEPLNSTSRAIPDLTSSTSASAVGNVNDAVFNLGYTTSLPTNRSSFVPVAATQSLVQRSPFVNPASDFNPALIETLSDNHRSHLIREFNKRQRNMEEELLSLAALEASPFHANDMTFSPNGPLFHDFSPFIGTLHTGRTNDTLDDSSPMDTPLFGLDDGIPEEWPTLFPTEDAINPSSSTDILVNPAALMIGGESSSTPPLTAIIPSRQFSNDSNNSRTPPSPSMKSRSASNAQKRSSLTGISRRKAAADLPPVQFDPSNPVDIKRARNTMAARKSRARRVEKMEELAEAVEKLQAEAQQLKEEKEFYKNLARQHGALVD